jgi:hypothetical protein
MFGHRSCVVATSTGWLVSALSLAAIGVLVVLFVAGEVAAV